MSVLVKMCGLRSEADVDVAVEVGAEAVGFVFAESVRRVTPAEAAAATSNLRNDIRKVAVMRHPTNEEWQDVLLEFRPDVLQTDIADFESLEVPDIVQCLPVIREGDAVLDGDLPDVFLYEGANSGTGETVAWAAAANVALRGRMVLAGGLNADNVADAIQSVKPFGVDVSSGIEGEPGVKSAEKMTAFIEAVRAVEPKQ